MNRRIAIYARVSTIQQDTDAQITECRAYAQRCGYEVAGIYEDKISGVTSNNDRPELSRLLEDAFAQKFTAVVVYSIDRLGRSLKNCLEILESLKSHRCDFISLKQQIDTSSATGQLIFNIFACLANYERTMILERTALGRARAKERGVKFGRPSNYNESVASAVRVLRAKGAGIREIQKSLGIGSYSVYKALNASA
jgi:DNA invertase Pin-like site-specific DNA recombinase